MAASKALLKLLRIDNASSPPSRAEALQRHVQPFHWDGDEGFQDDFEDFGDHDSDFVKIGAWWEDFFIGTLQTEWEW